MNCFCVFCGTKISKSEIRKQWLRARCTQCTRWINFYGCKQCGKHFDYRLLQKHKTIFEKILLDLNTQQC